MSEPNEQEAKNHIEESFAQMVATVKDYAIFVLDPHGNVRTWNEGARRIKQYSKDEIIGKHFSIFYTDEDKKLNHPAYELLEARKNGSYEEEGWRVKKDGSMFWAAVTITAMSAGKGFIKVTRDLTERRRHEIELAEAKEQAMAASRAKSQFVANVSHEIRTPLTSLVGLSELLVQDKTLSDELHHTAQIMLESSKQLLLLLNDLLDFSKLESKKVQLDHVPYSLKKLIRDVVELLRIKCDAKNLVLSYNISDDVPDQMEGDPAKVRQVLINLLDNSVKFTDFGAIEVSAEVQDGNVVLEITDTGVGISKSKEQQLFKPFSQIHKDTKYGGTGLGLSISKQVINLMGGSMGFLSEENRGSSFWFSLPIRSTERTESA